MGWLDSFNALKQDENSFDSRLLRGCLPLVADGGRLSPSLIERASGLLASHLPKQLGAGEKSRLIFVLPNATQNLGRFLAVSLLLADFVQRQALGTNCQPNTLLRGDVLLITQHIRDCVRLLREVGLRYHSEKLSITEFWPIEVLSQYAPPPNENPRVFVANPGWSSVLGERGTIGSVVIDVSHPRTSDHLDFLLRQPSIASAPIQILVIPPWEQDRIAALQEKDRTSDLIWAWDPAAVDALEQLLAPSVLVPKEPTERFLWLSDDPDVEEPLVELHSLLVGAMKAGKGRVPPRVLEAWATYHKLRQLAVPLVALEEERRDAYQTLTLQERIRELEEDPPEAHGPLGSYLDSRWPLVVCALKKLYDVLLHRKEPAKFYTLACVVEEFLENKEGSDTLRIVVPTAHEANMLAALLGEIVASWAEALQEGVVSLTTLKEEPRLIAEGLVQPTVLLGFRTSETRYLDVYPSVPVHVVSYPYEAEVDDGIQHRIHASIESLQENGPRTVVLKQLRLPAVTSNGDGTKEVVPRSKRALSRRRFEVQPRLLQNRRFLDDDAVEPLNLERIAGLSWFEEVGAYDAGKGGDGSRRSIDYCEITDTEGEKYRFPVGRLIDVFRPATEQKERIPAGALEPGMLIVRLVDDPYEDLFQRLLEAIREQRDIRASMALELWARAKPAALTKHGGSRTKLHRSLVERGLSVDYAAVVGWYRSGEDEIIAPASREDFELLARASGIYSDAERLKATFNCIQRERNIRRACGRQLSRLLSNLAAGEHYEIALKSADVIDIALEQVVAAVALREVESVRKLGKYLDMVS